MSTMLVAASPVDAAAPRPPRHSLLDVAQRLLDFDTWKRGLALIPYPPDLPGAIDTCAELSESLATKETPDDLVLPDVFPSFMGYLGELCTARSIGEEFPEWQARANVALQARRSWLLERQLMNGTYITAPYLGDANANVIAGALASRVALAQLEALGAATGQEYWIHMPPEVASHLGYERLQEDRSGIVRTATGAPVVIGHGYSQDDNTPGVTTAPATKRGLPPVGQAAAGDRKSWIYVTGPVLAAVADSIFLNPGTMSEARDWEQNTVVYRAEQPMVVGWDGQLQGAVLADWSGS